MELYELIIEDENVDEVMALSLVENPAIEANWVFFNNQKEVHFATIDAEKRTIVAPVLIPDKKIYRIDERTGKEYNVFLTAETIEKLAQNYLRKGYQDKATYEHTKNIDGDVTVVESWISKSSTKDKSSLYFNRAFPVGTWFVTMKVNNEKLWQDYVKTGKVKAISVEMLVGHKLVKAAAELELMEKNIEELTDEESAIVLSKIMAVIKSDKRFKEGKRIEMESYSDYGEGIRNNAKRGIELNERNGNKCATQTGKVRAQQIAKGEPLSVETIKRMFSYLSRAEVYYDNAESENDCGNISYLLWGGKAALSYSRNKLRELGLLELEELSLKIPSPPVTSYIKDIDLAEVGPRGGIKESPKAPKSDTPNPEPKGEGTAEGKASGKRGAVVSAEDEKTLEGKVKDFNERESNTKYGKATLGALKSVFQRGLGAFNVSHSPRVQSASQWAFARVNAFLYLLKNGRPENPKYTSDFDLLPKDHPKYSTQMEANPQVTSTYPGEVAEDNKKKKLK